MIIVIEGIDKAGKRTQTNMLKDELERMGYTVKIMHFPDYSTIIGKEIYHFLHSVTDYPVEVKHMLLSANRWEKKREIEAIKKNEILIIDRYYQSNLAYGLANGLDILWLENLDKGLPDADLVIVIDVNIDTISHRLKESGKDEFENIEMLKKVSSFYKELANKYGWIIVDGNKSKEDVHKDILNIVVNHIKNKNY